MAKQLSIVILTCNQRELLMACLASLGKLTTSSDCEIIVVDNASHDGTAHALRSQYPGVTLVENSENRGVAAARNQGLKLAKGQWLMLLDNDTVASPQAVEQMMRYMHTHPDVGLCGCRLTAADGTVQDSAKPFPGLMVKVRNVLGITGKQPELVPDDEGNLEPLYVIGACQMFARSTFEAVGSLDESIFYGPEDADFCIRVAATGKKIKYLTHITIIHHFQRSTTHSILSPLGRKHIKGLLHFWRKHRRLW